jgi:hypothetical protein
MACALAAAVVAACAACSKAQSEITPTTAAAPDESALVDMALNAAAFECGWMIVNRDRNSLSILEPMHQATWHAFEELRKADAKAGYDWQTIRQAGDGIANRAWMRIGLSDRSLPLP